MSANALTLLVIDAFAAAMFGGSRACPAPSSAPSCSPLDQLRDRLLPGEQVDLDGRLRASIPMILLFIILLVLPQDRLRGTTVLRTRERFRMPSLRNAWIAGLVLVVVVWACARSWPPPPSTRWPTASPSASIALSLVLLTGYAGEINLAALSFGAIGTIGLPLRHQRHRQRGAHDPVGHPARAHRLRGRGSSGRAPCAAPQRPLPGPRHHGFRRVRLPHGAHRDR